MRTKKASLNSIANVASFIILIAPSFILRKVFLNVLGEDLLGLNYLFQNIIGFLSLAELGVGTAIMYSLYKPIANDDHIKIKGYLNFFSKAYKLLGGIIVLSGILVIPFLQLFIKGDVATNISIFAFLFFLINTFITYLFSYKLTILEASQRGYWITSINLIFRLLIIGTQLLTLYYKPNYFVFLFIQLISDIIYFLVMDVLINRKYPWLKRERGNLADEEKDGLKQNIKAIFFHKIGTFLVFGTDNLLISFFIGLKAVARFNNYNMIIFMFENIMNRLFKGMTASIGNLIATSDAKNVYRIHNRLFFLNFVLASFIIIPLYNSIDQFICIWLGEKYLIDNLTLSVVLFNVYFKLMRLSVEHFKHGSGLYHQDRFASIIESIVNLGCSLILVRYIGLAGIFMGTLISNLLIVFWVKPKIVYKYVFKISVFKYFERYFYYLALLLISLVTTNHVSSYLNKNYTLIFFTFNILINLIILTILYLLFFGRSNDFRYFLNLLRTRKIN